MRPRDLPVAGERLGGYVLEKVLGRGGMGAVYLGRNEAGTARAIKVPLFDGPDAEDLRARFVREGQALARLNVPGVVRVHATGEDCGRLFCVLELIEGRSLATVLAEEGPLPVARALDLAEQIATTLAQVHAAGLLHRDLKPSNVLLRGEDGTAVLTDFGLARASGLESLTTTGVLVGTPAYMAPEQVDGKQKPDARTDVYGLGATLYELLTGTPPFQGEGALPALMKRILMDAPAPPSSRRTGIPAAVDELVLRALAKRREDRPGTASLLARELARARQGSSRSSRPRALVVVSVLLALAIAAAAVMTRERPPAPVTPTSDGGRAELERALAAAEAVRPDGASDLSGLEAFAAAVAAVVSRSNEVGPDVARARIAELVLEEKSLRALAWARAEPAAATRVLAALERTGGPARPASRAHPIHARLRARAFGRLGPAVTAWLLNVVKQAPESGHAALHELLEIVLPGEGDPSLADVLRTIELERPGFANRALRANPAFGKRLEARARRAQARGEIERALEEFAYALRADHTVPVLALPGTPLADSVDRSQGAEQLVLLARARLAEVSGDLDGSVIASCKKRAAARPAEWAPRAVLLMHLARLPWSEGASIRGHVATHGLEPTALFNEVLTSPETPRMALADARLHLSRAAARTAGEGRPSWELDWFLRLAHAQIVMATPDCADSDVTWVELAHVLLERARYEPAELSKRLLLDEALAAARKAVPEAEARIADDLVRPGCVPRAPLIDGPPARLRAGLKLAHVLIARRELDAVPEVFERLERTDTAGKPIAVWVKLLWLLAQQRDAEVLELIRRSPHSAADTAHYLGQFADDLIVAGLPDRGLEARAWAIKVRSGEVRTR